MTTPYVRLGELDVAIQRGFPSSRATSSGPVPVRSVAALREHTPARHFTTDAELIDIGLTLAQPSDVLVTIEGGSNVGEVMVLRAGLDDFVPSQQVATLRVRSAPIDAWYLGAWFSSGDGQAELQRLTRGTTIKRVSVKDLAAALIPVPPIDQQRQIGARLRAFDVAIDAHQALVASLAELRDLDLAAQFASLSTSTPEQ